MLLFHRWSSGSLPEYKVISAKQWHSWRPVCHGSTCKWPATKWTWYSPVTTRTTRERTTEYENSCFATVHLTTRTTIRTEIGAQRILRFAHRRDKTIKIPLLQNKTSFNYGQSVSWRRKPSHSFSFRLHSSKGQNVWRCLRQTFLPMHMKRSGTVRLLLPSGDFRFVKRRSVPRERRDIRAPLVKLPSKEHQDKACTPSLKEGEGSQNKSKTDR